MTAESLDSYQIGVGHVSISALERRYVNEVLDSQRLTYGPFSRRFEAEMAVAHGVRHAVLTNSGTSALHVAVLALKELYGWADGDEVIVPAVTFIATANVVVMAGLRPVFVDVDPRTYNLSPGLIEPAITVRTRAVLPVHLCGLPADMPAIMEVCRRRGLRVIEDSCETMFARVHDRPVGSFGDIACFSTYAAHVLTTGVGGLAITNDPELAVIMRSLCNHGRDAIYLAMDDDLGVSGGELRTMMERRFHFVRPGASYRITELEAAIGVAQLERRTEMLAARARNAAVLTAGLRNLESAGQLQLPTVPPGLDHVFMFYPLVVTASRVCRDDITFALEQNGIETRPLMPLINQPVFTQLVVEQPGRWPVAESLNERAFYVGCHPGLSRTDLDHMIGAITAAVTTAVDRSGSARSASPAKLADTTVEQATAL